MQQLNNSGVALGKTSNGVANNAKVINNRVATKIIKIYNIKGPDVVSEVEYIWNGSAKKDEVNANLILCDWSNLKYPQ